MRRLYPDRGSRRPRNRFRDHPREYGADPQRRAFLRPWNAGRDRSRARHACCRKRLSVDFSSARFVSRQTDEGSAAVAFAAEQAAGGRPASVVFVGAARVGSPPLADDELISLAIEEDGEVRRLVRRRGPWPGPRARFEDVTLQDAVVLIEGKLDISFAFGRITPDGGLAWYANWAGERALPRYVRLMLRDRATGADLLGEADFSVRANAPSACGRTDAARACLSALSVVETDTSDEERPVR
jgi:hypothetical protein